MWQDANRTALYAANAVWWDAGGYNGNTDEEAMMGDDESATDIEDSQVRHREDEAQRGAKRRADNTGSSWSPLLSSLLDSNSLSLILMRLTTLVLAFLDCAPDTHA
ncbi:hypothetical protein TL16_g02693 [Triparma laevis f. inornata]|uniref:Uncharacterized protein n=1 Tax=Triparma laevis f. inornata TaxID=1714386 RepID=A0A9W7DYK4_9STRA|nr:hypothetical protein TL16_g02693 [Triparma laevis f. inornata]